MGVSRFYMVLVVFFCYAIVYISLRVIIDYFNPDGLIYLNMYSIYYGCFLLTLLLAIICNYYINDTNLKEITGIELSPPIYGVGNRMNIEQSNEVGKTNDATNVVTDGITIDGVKTDKNILNQSKDEQREHL